MSLVVEVSNSGNGDIFWIEATSPVFDRPIVHYCTYHDPGETVVYSDFMDPLGDSMEGHFDLAAQPVDVTVRVGGMADGVHCDNGPTQGQVTDTATVTIGPSDNGGNGTDPGNGNGDLGCNGQIQAAQTYCDNRRGGSSAQVKRLRCPGSIVTYKARNGCEIGYLKERGWKEVSMNAAAMPAGVIVLLAVLAGAYYFAR